MLNSLWIDLKYCNLLSFRLEGFKRKNNTTFNFRCPICNDSKKNKRKMRGYLYEHKGEMKFCCHNCNASKSLRILLKDIYPELYKEYCVDKIKENNFTPTSKFISQIENFGVRRTEKFEPFVDLKKISQLDATHIAKKYCVDRKIPFKQHFRLYYTPKFFQWTNKFIPNKFSLELENKNDPRLILPLIDRDGYVFAATGRALTQEQQERYITIRFDESAPKIFGMDQVDFKNKVYIFEGPIDSLFIDNSLAFAGSAGELETLPLTKDSVIVLDNQPRNSDVVRQMNKLLTQGYNVCVWPEFIHQKDVNEMILEGGLSPQQIKDIIDANQYSGLAGLAAINKWKKV